MELVIQSDTKVGIPVLEVFEPSKSPARGLIIMQHGYTLRKEHCLPQASLMAREGFFMVLPDAYQHGENQPSDQANLLQSVLFGSRDLNRLLAAYAEDARIQSGKAAYVGYSMGALIGYHYLAGPHVRIQAATLFIGTPDWSSLVGSEQAKEHFISKGLADENSWPKVRQMIIQHDPAQKPMAPIPLLMLNGDLDPLIPIDGVKGYFQRQKKHHANSDDLCLKIIAGQDHSDTWDMNQQALEWITLHLK